MFLQVRWPNQQCQSTEGGWLVIQIALNLTRLIPPCYNNTTCMSRRKKTNRTKNGTGDLSVQGLKAAYEPSLLWWWGVSSCWQSSWVNWCCVSSRRAGPPGSWPYRNKRFLPDDRSLPLPSYLPPARTGTPQSPTFTNTQSPTHWHRTRSNLNYTVSQEKNVTLFIFAISLSDFIRFCYFWQKHTPGNLKQTHTFGFMCSYCTL